jgi:hypothetical protein
MMDGSRHHELASAVPLHLARATARGFIIQQENLTDRM